MKVVESTSDYDIENQIHEDFLQGAYWKKKRMRFYFLSPYSPEQHRIELLWLKMKYEWLTFKTFTPDVIEQAVDEIGYGFNSQYTLTFC